jgi:hypothetical protein
MLDIFSQFATDEGLENGGTYFDLGGDAKVLVARAGNRKYSKLLTKQVNLHKQALDLEDDNAENMSDKIMASVMAQTILLGWTGVSFKGAELPYSTANAEMLLGIKDFRRQIAKFADDVSAFKVKEEAAQGEA